MRVLGCKKDAAALGFRPMENAVVFVVVRSLQAALVWLWKRLRLWAYEKPLRILHGEIIRPGEKTGNDGRRSLPKRE